MVERTYTTNQGRRHEHDLSGDGSVLGKTGVLAWIADLLDRHFATCSNHFSDLAMLPPFKRVSTNEKTESWTMEICEHYLTILDLQAEQRVVTVLEIVSPATKQEGLSRELYLANTRKVLSSQSHLVEIDLLRTGRYVLSVPEKLARGNSAIPYLISVNRAEKIRDRFEVYRYTLRDRLPIIAVPLEEDSPPVVLDLQQGLEREYEAGCYRDRLHYDRPCIPRLSPEDQAWADERIKAAGVGSI